MVIRNKLEGKMHRIGSEKNEAVTQYNLQLIAIQPEVHQNNQNNSDANNF